ncbi:uncharacterized protein LOC127285770 [Leptopilina boulardi]|uniref:uncharacterized protein LOC127285770 n=1 Tax=Leptopilina boulardi TaxID=63433 RepID=UPI0021F57E2E|nr:uncharacterized protein LOC127285770 [Leptopilina boulardi]
MDVLPENFRTLWLCGLWHEHKKFSLTFFIYKILILCLICHISLGQLLFVFVTSKSVKELTTGLVFTVKFIELCVKLINFLFKKKEMEKLLTIFREDICQGILREEIFILNKYRIKNRQFFWIFLIVSESMTTIYMIQCVLNWNENMELPFQIYDPFNFTDYSMMILFYITEVIECSYSVCLNVCFDTMVYGFINLTCGLYELLCFRIKRCDKKNSKLPLSVKECVQLHITILQILNNVKTFFMGAITIMFVFTLSVICSGIFVVTEVILKIYFTFKYSLS